LTAVSRLPEAGRFHHRRPALLAGAYAGRQVGAGLRRDIEAHLLQSGAHGGFGVRRFRRIDDFCEHVGRRAGMREQAEPGAGSELG